MDSYLLLRIRRYILIGVIASLYIAILPLQQSINYSRAAEDLAEDIVIMPGEFVTNFIIGGFRGIASDILWIQIDEFWHHGKWFEIMPLLRAITWMQPHFLEAWELGGWHLAYNLYAHAEGPAAREMFVEEGIRFLKGGLAKNRNVYNLHFNLGWIYYNKLNDYDEAIRFLKSAARHEHPAYIDRLIAHAYHEKGDLEAEYRQWQHCLTIFKDNSYHIEIVKKHLAACEETLSKLKR